MLGGGASRCHHGQGWRVPIVSAPPLLLDFLLPDPNMSGAGHPVDDCPRSPAHTSSLLQTDKKRPWKSLSTHPRSVGLSPGSRAHSFSVMESATGQSTCPAVDLTTDLGSITPPTHLHRQNQRIELNTISDVCAGSRCPLELGSRTLF